jgi:hypothetical protein
MNRIVIGGIGATAILLVTSGLVSAQQAAPPAAPAAQLTADALVPAADATHIATLRSTAAAVEGQTPRAGTAWVILDPQNNTVKWTIEYTGVSVGRASLICTGVQAPAGGAAAATTLDLGTERTATPIQGETAQVAQELFAAIQGGTCIVVLAPATPGPGGIRGALNAVPAPAATPAP